MISSISYFAQNRKGKLVSYLNNNTDELTLEKQHQIYGAITELDNILQMLSSFKGSEQVQEKNPEDIFLFKPIHGKGVFDDIKEFVKDIF